MLLSTNNTCVNRSAVISCLKHSQKTSVNTC